MTYEPCVLGADGRCTRWSHDHDIPSFEQSCSECGEPPFHHLVVCSRVDGPNGAGPVSTIPPRLAVDASGYVWRVYDDGWSMAPVNPDNSPIPEPVTFYEPVSDEPRLGLATTRELLDELTARIEVDGANGGGGLGYRTVDAE